MLESPEVTFPVHLDRNTYVRYTFGSICGMVSLILFGVLLFAINWIPDKNGSDGFSWLATGIVAAVVTTSRAVPFTCPDTSPIPELSLP